MAAIYQWFPDTDGFIDFEFVLLATDQGWLTRYLGLDYSTGIYTDFGALYTGKNVSIVCDGQDMFIDDISPRGDISEFVWRGNVFSKVGQGSHGGSNASKCMNALTGLPDELLVIGAAAFGHGIRVVPVNPFGTGYAKVATNDFWAGAYDLNYGNNGVRGYGDALVTLPKFGQDLVVFEIVGGLLVERSAASAGAHPGELPDWGFDSQSGKVVARRLTSGTVDIWQVNMTTLILSYEGPLVCAGATDIYAVGFSPNGFIVTVENDTPDDKLKVYDDTGVLKDSYTLIGNHSTAVSFQISRITGRIWLLGTFQSNILVFSVDDDGLITIEFNLPNYTVGSSGYVGNPISFMDTPITVTPNGFTGIKEKLFECWEMNEVGSVSRAGALNISYVSTTLAVSGTVIDRPGTIGNAADFDGASALVSVNPLPIELRTVSTFSVCMDVTLDHKASTQKIMARGRINAQNVSGDQHDLGIEYDLGTDRLRFYVIIGSTKYACNVNISPVIGQKYHIYAEYNKQADQIGFRLDGGTIANIALPAGSTINLYPETTECALMFGRKTSWPTQEEFFNGGNDQIFWFWDKLTTAEQDWMYNSGNSRAFSEL